MTTLFMLVGLPGSGKSFTAKVLSRKNNAEIIESDAYREKLYGDASIQGDNNKLFEKIHKDVFDLLNNGVNVIFDATNISYKHRIALLRKIEKLPIEKICYLLATELRICSERNKGRDRVVPDYVLDRMWKSFTVPQYREGFDKIEILFEYEPENYNLGKYHTAIMGFEQDNIYHTKSLGDHIQAVVDNIRAVKGDNNLLIAGFLHDNGKLHTKTFKNMKGVETEGAHYYSHENVGAYEALFFLNEYKLLNPREILWICGLIQYHMRAYHLETEKAKEKLLNLVGREMYEQLVVLNEADRKAH